VAVVSTGIDIVEIARLEASMARHPERFGRRVFTDAERAYCEGRAKPAIHFAGRFAAKEAVLKALRTGWAKGIGWTNVEVTSGSAGEPSVVLTGGAAERAQAMGIERIHISISHTDSHAVASAVAESD
jgi:holo-[acyl-carrier protein] synthase